MLDTGVFDDDRYFDVFVEYAKAGPEDLLIQISVVNRGPEAAHVARAADALVSQHLVLDGSGTEANTEGRWTSGRGQRIRCASHRPALPRITARLLSVLRGRDVPLLFTENETNQPETLREQRTPMPIREGWYPRLVVHGRNRRGESRPAAGPKLLPHYHVDRSCRGVPKVRFGCAGSHPPVGSCAEPFAEFRRAFRERRQQEADEFYDSITPPAVRADAGPVRVMRQALAGMLWSKQYYLLRRVDSGSRSTACEPLV